VKYSPLCTTNPGKIGQFETNIFWGVFGRS
jgi:hypothetical protein